MNKIQSLMADGAPQLRVVRYDVYENLPHTEEEIKHLLDIGKTSKAVDYRLDNNRYIKRYELKKGYMELSKELERDDITQGRRRFLSSVGSIISGYTTGDLERMLHDDLDDNIYILLWYIDRSFSHLIRFELEEDMDKLTVIKYEESKEIDTIIMLLDLINILKDRKVPVSELISLIVGIE